MISLLPAVCLGISLCFAPAKPAEKAADKDYPTESAKSGGNCISVSSVNGQTTITYQGKQVWKGLTKGAISGKSASINGDECAAAFEDDKVLWESRSGAAEELKSGAAAKALEKAGANKALEDLKKDLPPEIQEQLKKIQQ
jgi:hypothetical protein